MPFTTTYDSQSFTKRLEQRWKAIEDIFPCDDRPVTTAAEKVPGTNSIISWVEENITLTTAANKKVEGADYSYSANNTAAKRTNYVQKIQNGDIVTDLNDLSEHLEIGGANARKSRVKYLMMEQSLLDLEWSLINSTAAIGNNSTAAEMAGLIAQCGASFTTTAASASPTTAAKRTVTYNTENGASAAASTSLVTMLGKNWSVGGKIKRLLVNYNQKTSQFDSFTVAGYQRNTNLAESGKGSAVLTYEKVVTAAGTVDVIPHPMIADGAMVGYDPRSFKVVEVQEFKCDPKVARTGDSDKISVFGYYSSKLTNQKAALYAVNFNGVAIP